MKAVEAGGPQAKAQMEQVKAMCSGGQPIIPGMPDLGPDCKFMEARSCASNPSKTLERMEEVGKDLACKALDTTVGCFQTNKCDIKILLEAGGEEAKLKYKTTMSMCSEASCDPQEFRTCAKDLDKKSFFDLEQKEVCEKGPKFIEKIMACGKQSKCEGAAISHASVFLKKVKSLCSATAGSQSPPMEDNDFKTCVGSITVDENISCEDAKKVAQCWSQGKFYGTASEAACTERIGSICREKRECPKPTSGVKEGSAAAVIPSNLEEQIKIGEEKVNEEVAKKSGPKKSEDITGPKKSEDITAGASTASFFSAIVVTMAMTVYATLK